MELPTKWLVLNLFHGPKPLSKVLPLLYSTFNSLYSKCRNWCYALACCIVVRSLHVVSKFGTNGIHTFNKIVFVQGWDMELLPVGSLYCHTAAVTCLAVCGAFRVFASGSADGTATLWDLDSHSYIRSLTGHSGPVTTLAVSQTSGDVCTVCDSGGLL